MCDSQVKSDRVHNGSVGEPNIESLNSLCYDDNAAAVAAACFSDARAPTIKAQTMPSETVSIIYIEDGIRKIGIEWLSLLLLLLLLDK